jgi:hypothetical protein
MYRVSRHTPRIIMQGSKAARIARQPLTHRLSSRSSSPERLRLARLPVPNLEDTVARYLKSLEPFLLEDAAQGGPSFEVAQARYRELAHKFVKDSGSERQTQLNGTFHTLMASKQDYNSSIATQNWINALRIIGWTTIFG